MTWTVLWRKHGLVFQAQSLFSGITKERAMATRLKLCMGSPSHRWLFSLPAAVTNPELVMIPHAPGGSVNHLEASWLHWPSPIIICPLWNTHTLDLNLLSLPTVLQSAPRHLDLEYFKHYHCVWHHIVSDQETHSVMREVMQWTIAHRLHWYNCYSITKKQLILLKT